MKSFMRPILQTSCFSPVPAVDNYRATGGQGFLTGPFHFLHQLQQGWSLVWGLLIRPGSVPVLPQSALLFPALVHAHRQWHRCHYTKHTENTCCSSCLTKQLPWFSSERRTNIKKRDCTKTDYLSWSVLSINKFLNVSPPIIMNPIDKQHNMRRWIINKLLTHCSYIMIPWCLAIGCRLHLLNYLVLFAKCRCHHDLKLKIKHPSWTHEWSVERTTFQHPYLLW